MSHYIVSSSFFYIVKQIHNYNATDCTSQSNARVYVDLSGSHLMHIESLCEYTETMGLRFCLGYLTAYLVGCKVNLSNVLDILYGILLCEDLFPSSPCLDLTFCLLWWLLDSNCWCLLEWKWSVDKWRILLSEVDVCIDFMLTC